MADSAVAIIGGGILGLASARALLQSNARLRLVLLEKEPRVALHQSTHNSGVLHAGLHYAPGSNKAILSRRGIRMMTEYCVEKSIAHDICGKLVAAVDAGELARLRALQQRGEQNGLRGLRWLEPAEARELEPHLSCVGALQVPEEGIVDYGAVCAALAADCTAAGATIVTGAQVRQLKQRGGVWQIETTRGDYSARIIVNCAGLQVDRVARLAGERPQTRIVPFRGEYYKLRPERQHLVRNLIYPVPDPTFPFLGVHFTRLVLGGIEAGPNAVLALAREGYRKTDVELRDLMEIAGFGGFWRFLLRYPRAALDELGRSLSKPLFLRALQRLVPEVQEADLTPGGAGVRAQPIGPDGRLVHDFEWIERAGAVHVISAPSPAATASLAIGGEIAARVLAQVGN